MTLNKKQQIIIFSSLITLFIGLNIFSCKTQKTDNIIIEEITLEEASQIYPELLPTINNETNNTTKTISQKSSELPRHISDKCKEHIKKYESCKLTAYWDSNGYSIGWGHHGPDVKKGQNISQAKADQLFNKDIAEAEKCALYLISKLPYEYQFSQEFFDGMVDLIYNCGVGNIQKSTFYNRLKNCRVSNGNMNLSDYNYTLAAVKTTNAPKPGHKKRRAETYQMMIG